MSYSILKLKNMSKENICAILKELSLHSPILIVDSAIMLFFIWNELWLKKEKCLRIKEIKVNQSNGIQVMIVLWIEYEKLWEALESKVSSKDK